MPATDQKARWRVPFSIAVVGLFVSLVLAYKSDDLGFFATVLLIAPAVILSLIAILIVSLVRKRWRTAGIVALTLTVYGISSWEFLRYSSEVRSEERWVLHSRTLKAQVLAQPQSSSNGLRYVVWDDWGMFTMDTNVYLVFSPDDELRNYRPNHLAGLPCAVWKVQSLEPQWYSVTFYANTRWPDPFDLGHPCQ